MAGLLSYPVTHAIKATRGLLLGGPVAGAASITLLWSARFLIVIAYRRRA
ncbi:hypothetical protein [Nonomuraea endophytica]